MIFRVTHYANLEARSRAAFGLRRCWQDRVLADMISINTISTEMILTPG
jgi:hypothetical protein